MKSITKLLIIATSLCNLMIVSAQDMIVLKNGDIITAKVREINDSTIKYHKFTNLDGPIYSIGINKVLSINYENGEKDMFDSPLHEPPVEENTTSNGEVYVNTSNNNSEIITKYSKLLTTNHLKIKGTAAKNVLTKFSPTPNSVFSNVDIEIFFKMPHLYLYEIWIKNKTDKPIYIDLGNSFRVDSDNMSRRYFNQSETTSVSNGNSSGAGINIGAITQAAGVGGIVGTLANGISVGGGNSSSTTTTYSNERIVVVPPMGVAPLSQWKSVSVSGVYSRKWISYGENFWLSQATNPAYFDESIKLTWMSFSSLSFEPIPDYNMPFIKYGSIRIHESKTFTFNDSPLTKEYSIRYYKDDQLATYSTLKFGLYLAQIIGAQYTKYPYTKDYIDLGFNPNFYILGISKCSK